MKFALPVFAFILLSLNASLGKVQSLESLVLGDSTVEMVIAQNGAIKNIKDLESNTVLAKSPEVGANAWSLLGRNGSDHKRINSSGASSPKIKKSKNSLEFRWRCDNELTVILWYVFVPESREFRLRSKIDYRGRGVIEKINLPSALSFDASEGNYQVADGNIPRECASAIRWLAKMPEGEKQRLMYPGIMKMQMLGYKIGKSSLLMYTDDSKSNIKWHYLVRKGNTVRQDTELFTKISRRANKWDRPYDIVFKVIPGGDYNDLAKEYAKWARHQYWASVTWKDKVKRCSPLNNYAENGFIRFHTPSQTPFKQNKDGVWEFTAKVDKPLYDVCLARMDWFESLGIKPGYWWPVWSGHRFDTGYPDFFPVKEYMGDFKKFRDTVAEKQRPIMYHINMAHWPVSCRSYSDKIAATQPNGSFWNQTWSNILHRNVSPALTIKRELKSIRRINDHKDIYNGLYIDVLGATYITDNNPKSPYSKYPNSFQLARINSFKKAREANDAPIMTEGRSEGFMPFIDFGFGYIGHAKEDPVPLWQLVYGDIIAMQSYIDRYDRDEYVAETCTFGAILELPRTAEEKIKRMAAIQKALSPVVGKLMLRYDRKGAFRISQWEDGIVIWRRPEGEKKPVDFEFETILGKLTLEEVNHNGLLILMKNGNRFMDKIKEYKIDRNAGL